MEKYAKITVDKLNRQQVQQIKKRCDHVNRGEHTHACNVNPELSHLNKTLVGEENANWYHLYQQRYNELAYYQNPDNRSMYKNAVIMLEAVTSVSYDAMEDINVDEWAMAEVEWVQKHYGKENVVHAVLHRDEHTYHIHFCILPIRDGRFCAREINGGPHDFQKLQTEHAKAMEPFGLRRGLQAGSGRMKYGEIKELYRKTTEDVVDLPEVKQGETAEEYRERVNELYRGVQINRNGLRNENERLKKIREYAHELEEKVASLLQEVKRLTRRKIGKLFIENIMAAIENYPDRNIVSQFIKSLEVNLEDWHEAGKQYMKEPLIDEPEHEVSNSIEDTDDSTEGFEDR